MIIIILPEVPQRLGRAVIRRDDCVERVVFGHRVAVRADVLVPGVGPVKIGSFYY